MKRAGILTLALALSTLAVPAAAETFTIKMSNGTQFESRYAPTEAPWDSEKVLFLNEIGTRMTLARADVVDIVASSEASGFGKVIDSTTIDLGILMIDIPKEEDESAEDVNRDRFVDYLQSQTVDQFVEPGDAGAAGVPAWGFGGAPPPRN